MFTLSPSFYKSKTKYPVIERDGLQYKECSRCHKELTLDNFNKRNKYEPRLLTICKDCNNAKRRLASKLSKLKNDH